MLGGSIGVLLARAKGGAETIEDLVTCIGAFAVSGELQTGLHHAFEHAQLQVAFVKVGLGEGIDMSSSTSSSDIPKMATIFSVSDKVRH